MIQRIQSVYLLLSVILMVVCLCLPVGRFVASMDGGQMYNLYALSPNGGHTFVPCALFVILILTSAIDSIAIFLFKNRPFQMRIALFSSILLVLYYVIYSIISFMVAQSYSASFAPSITAGFPAIAAVLNFLAFIAIRKDERLVRDSDRLRR